MSLLSSLVIDPKELEQVIDYAKSNGLSTVTAALAQFSVVEDDIKDDATALIDHAINKAKSDLLQPIIEQAASLQQDMRSLMESLKGGIHLVANLNNPAGQPGAKESNV